MIFGPLMALQCGQLSFKLTSHPIQFRILSCQQPIDVLRCAAYVQLFVQQLHVVLLARIQGGQLAVRVHLGVANQLLVLLFTRSD